MASITRARLDAIAEAAIAGEEAAFGELYEALATSVFNLVMRSVHDRAVAEDICQDVWVKAHREIHTVRSPEALSSWLYRMASRACIDYSRSRACRERGALEITEEMVESRFGDPEQSAMRRSELRDLWVTLAAMPPRQSMALYLKQVDGRSYEEIGRILGCPTSAVETLLFRARHGLVRAKERLQSDPRASCKMIGATMSVVLDREGTPIQQRAVDAHVAACKSCRNDLAAMKQGVAGYGWLPMLPAGGHALSAALAAGGASTGAGLGMGRIISMLLVKGKASGLAFVTASAVATAGVAGAAAALAPTMPGFLDFIGEAVTSARNATIGGGAEDESASLKAAAGTDPLPPRAPLAVQPPQLAVPPAARAQAAASNQSALPPAAQLDPQLALSGLPGLLSTASEGLLGSVDPLLAFVDGTLAGLLQDPGGSLNALLTSPGTTVDGLTRDATQALDETAENATTTVDDTFDQTTDIIDGLIGENELTGPLDSTAGNATGGVNTSVDTVTDAVDDTTGSLGGALDGLVGEEGLLGDTGLPDDGALLGEDGPVLGDEGLLGDDGLLGGSSESEEEPGEQDGEETCVLLILCN